MTDADYAAEADYLGEFDWPEYRFHFVLPSERAHRMYVYFGGISDWATSIAVLHSDWPFQLVMTSWNMILMSS